MSFSSNTKNELARIDLEKKGCMLAQIAGFLRMCGAIKLSGGGKMDVKLTTENAAVARLFIKLLKRYFGTKVDLAVADAAILKRAHSYELLISSEMNAEQILRETGILRVKEGCNYIDEGIFQDLIKKKCCKKAYLRGVFLGGGTISNPEKGYHLELVCNSEFLANDVKKLINGFGLHAKVVMRKKSYIVYLKESEQITDFLNILGAHTQLLDFENIRIVKQMRNKTNRIVNCESANLDKTVNASVRQIEDIQMIRDTRGLAILPEKLFSVAQLRLDNPEASLNELAELMQPPLKKSGINHRLKKIEELANKLRQSKQES